MRAKAVVDCMCRILLLISFLSLKLSFRLCSLVGFSLWLVSSSQPSVGSELLSTSEAACFAICFTPGVGSAVCINPFSEGLVGLASGRFGTGIVGYAFGRSSRDPLDIDVTLGSGGGGSTQFDSDVPGGPSLDRKTSDEKWRHGVVVGILPGNALWVLTPSRSIELVDFTADTLRDAKILHGVQLPSARPRPTGAYAVSSVQVSWKKRSNWQLHRRWITKLLRGSPSLNVDRTPKQRCKMLRKTSLKVTTEEKSANPMRGELDAGIQSLEMADE